MEDADTAILRKKFGPTGKDFAWHKLALGAEQAVKGLLGEISMKTKKDGTQPKHNTKHMVASNSPAQDSRKEAQRHSPDSKPRVSWSPEEKEQVLNWVEKRMRVLGIGVPGEGLRYRQESTAYLGLFRSAQEALFHKSRWKTFEARHHVEQMRVGAELTKRLQAPPTAIPPERAAITELAQAMDNAPEQAAASAEPSVIHLPIQAGERPEQAEEQPGEPIKDATTNGKEVRVITIDPDAKQRKTKVWWKSHELQSVLTLAVNKFKSLGVGTLPTKDDYSGSRMMLEVFNSAQHQMLPRERWKLLKSRAQLESVGLLENLQTLLRQAPKQTPVETACVPPPVTAPSVGAPVAPPPQGPGPVSPAIQATVAGSLNHLKPGDLGPLLQQDGVAAALATLGRAIMEGQTFAKQAAELTEMNTLLMEEVDGLRKRIEVLDTTVRAMNKEERKIVGHEKAKLPVVAVLGCRKDEFDIIVKKCQERGLKIELRLYEQDTKPRPITADWAIAMKFISHAWFDHMKECSQRGQYTLVRGGVGSMMQQLEVWFGGEESA